ncbi:MAG: hypothetical protein WCV71_03580 [Patescibacteria group bacterium]
MSLIKRLFVFSLVLTTVLWSFGGLKVNAAGNYGAGSLLALQGQSGAAVYYIGSDGKKYVFPDGKTYATWYANFNDVVRVSVTELDMYPDGGAVTYRAGTKLIKHENTAKIYAVGNGGTIHWVPSEAIAVALYGATWYTKVMDVIPGYFSSSYTLGADLSDKYPSGTLLQMGENMYVVDGTSVRPFADADAFEANNFVYANLIEVTSIAGYSTGESVTGEEVALSGFMAAEEDDTVVVDGNLTVSLYQTPEAMNMPELSSNDFLGLKLAAGSSAVSVESLTLTSYGLGDSENVDDVTIYQNGVKVGTSKNVNSDRKAVFNFSTPIEIAANSSVMLTVKATIAAAAVASETYGLGIASASDIVTGGTVGGSFPVMGNLMTDVAANIGTVVLSGVQNSDNVAVNFGEDNVLLAEFTLTTGSNEPLLWETARFRNGGTNNADVLDNLRIEVDGDIVAEGASLVDKYINFDMGSLLLDKSKAVNVEVYGDIGVASVNNTIDLYIDNASDFVFMGQTYGYGVQITSIATLDAAGDGIQALLAAADFTLDMDKAATPSKDVKAGDDNVVLATMSFTSNGENATINDISNTGTATAAQMDFYVETNSSQAAGFDDELSNFELRDVSNGILYDITATASTTFKGWALAMTDEIALTAGVTKTFELRVDVAGTGDTDAADDADTYKVYLESSAMNVTGDDSDATISDITPSSVSGTTATVRDGSLKVTTVALTNKSVVGGAGSVTPVVVYKAGLEVGDSSDLTLTSYQVDVTNEYPNFTGFEDSNVAQLDLYIVENGVSRLLKSTSNDITNDGLATAYINFTSLNTTNRVLKAGVDVELEVRALFASSFSSTTTEYFALEQVDNSGLNVVVKDSDNTDVDETIANGGTDSRVMTLSSAGTLKAEILTTDTKANDDMYILAGSESTHGRYLAELKFTTANEAIKLTDLALQEYGDSTGADVKVVKLYDSAGTVVAYKSPTADGHVHFEEGDFLNSKNVLAADQSTSFFVGVLTKTINADGDVEGTATFDNGIRYGFASSAALAVFTDLAVGDAVKATGVDSGSDISLVEDTNGGAAEVGDYTISSTKSKTASTTGSILTVITNDMANSTLSGGNNKIIGEYKFVFNNGNNRTAANTELKAQLRQLILTIATSSTTNVTDVQVYIEGDESNKTTAVDPLVGVATVDLTTLLTDTNLVDGTVTLVVIGDLAVVGADQYVQTEIASLTTDFTYNGNNGTSGANWVNARLDGISQVTGATLSN